MSLWQNRTVDWQDSAGSQDLDDDSGMAPEAGEASISPERSSMGDGKGGQGGCARPCGPAGPGRLLHFPLLLGFQSLTC